MIAMGEELNDTILTRLPIRPGKGFPLVAKAP